MPGFLYGVLVLLLNPAAVLLILLLGAAACWRRARASRALAALALGVLLVCGNGRVVGWLLRSLEWRSLPPDPVPAADAIVILSGGTLAQLAPRPSVEIADAGDRVLYGAELYRRGRAPLVVVTGDVSTGGIAPRPAADDMHQLLAALGVDPAAIVTERLSENTHDHAVNLCPIFGEHHVAHVLLVTSAIHMRRALGVFVRHCPAVTYTPAPTDFRATVGIPVPWYQHLVALIPTTRALTDFSDVAHEYVGLFVYRLRGWL